MTHSDFQQQLQNALRADAIPTDAQLRTMKAAAAQMHLQPPRPRLSFAAFLGTQVRFIGWKIWFLQALCLLLANGALDLLFGDYYFVNLRAAAISLGALAVLVMLTTLPFVYNAVVYQMQEMEAATYFSSQRLLAARLSIVGIGDMVMLAGLWGYGLWCTPLSAELLPLCLLLPFLLAAGGCLTLMSRCRPEKVCWGSVVWCGALFVAMTTTSSHLTLFSHAQAALTSILCCVALFLYCVWALQHLLKRSAFTELQLI